MTYINILLSNIINRVLLHFDYFLIMPIIDITFINEFSYATFYQMVHLWYFTVSFLLQINLINSQSFQYVSNHIMKQNPRKYIIIYYGCIINKYPSQPQTIELIQTFNRTYTKKQ